MLAFVLERPYVLVFIAYAAGIAAGHALPFPFALLSGSVWLLWGIILALAAFWWLWRKRPGLGLGLGFGGILLLAGWISVSLQLSSADRSPLLSLQRSQLSRLQAQPRPPDKAAPQEVDLVLSGNVASIPKVQRGYLRFMLDVSRARIDETWYKAPGRVYAFVKLHEDHTTTSDLSVHYASRVDIYCRLSEVEGPRNHGQFDYRAYLQQQGTLLQAFAFSPKALIIKDRRAPQPWAELAALRIWLTTNLTRGLDPDHAALAISVVYGDKITDLPETTRQRFREAGLTHILVASGTQVSLIIALLGLAFWRLEDNATWRGRLLNLAQFGATMTIVIAYATVTGFETSILRALAMGTLVLVGKLLLRESDGLTALAQSGFVLLLVNPLNLFSASFQLSFGATFGLIYFYGVFAPLLGKPVLGSAMTADPVAELRPWQPSTWLLWLREHGRQALISTCGAQLMVTPLLLSSFYQFSLWGFVSNLLAIPLAFLLLITGALSSVGLSAVPLLGRALQACVSLLAQALDGVAALFALLPGSQIAAPPPPLWWVLAYYLLLLSLGELYRRRRAGTLAHPATRWVSLAAGLTVLGGLLFWWVVPQPQLVSFALPGCEATLVRASTGRSLLLARSTGLERQHNAETLAAGLHWRGINRLHALIWLDNPDNGLDSREAFYRELGFRPDLELRPGEDLPASLDCKWLAPSASELPIALQLSIGGVGADVLLEYPKEVLAADLSGNVTFATGRVWLELSEQARELLLSAAGKLVIQCGAGKPDVDLRGLDLLRVDSECTAKPAGRALHTDVLTVED